MHARIPTDAITIVEATAADEVVLAALFTRFQIFYESAADAHATRRFIHERLCEVGKTRFFLAKIDAESVGFMHLLPYFETLALRKAWILEDLYVEPEYRRRGIGARLLATAERFARDDDASRLTLTTAHTNTTAQRVYERSGYVLDDVFRTYHRVLV